MRNRGFTLIELLVVISIIALLSSIMLSALGTARGKARLAAGKQFSSSVDHAEGDEAVTLVEFDECSSSVAIDRALGNSGSTFSGTPVTSSDTPYGIGCSMSFNGSNYIVLSSASVTSFPNAPFTASIWVKQAGPQSRAGFIGNAQYLTGGFMLAEGFSVANNRPFFDINISGSDCVAQGTADMPLNEWVSIAGVFDGSKMYIYQDGSLVASSACSSPGPSSIPLYIGRSPQGGWNGLVGQIDAVHLFAKALTATEVSDRYYAERPRFFAESQ